MQLTVKLFGSLREQAGAKELELELPDGARMCDLRRLLAGSYPILQEYGDRIAASVNLELAGPEQQLADGDEVAFLPPVRQLSSSPLSSFAPPGSNTSPMSTAFQGETSSD